jgi:hypothetical protein
MNMVKLGDEITVRGKIYKTVASQVPQEITMKELFQQLQQINLNLSILVDTLRWDGKYDSIDINIDANTERQGYPFNGDFKFRPRVLIISANQPISVQLNSTGNAPISLSVTEMPLNLLTMCPAMDVRRVFIATGQNSTQLKILAFG